MDIHAELSTDEIIRREKQCAEFNYTFAIRRKVRGGKPVLAIWNEQANFQSVDGANIVASDYQSDCLVITDNLNRIGFTAFVTVERCKHYVIRDCLARLSDDLLQLPWHNRAWFGRPCPDRAAPILPHIPDADLTVVAYFASDKALILNRVTTIQPGRFLKRYYQDQLSPQMIADLTANFSKATDKLKIQFAKTPYDCARIYMDGPGSCMDQHHGFEDVEMHPARVYGGPDLAVAYMMRNDRITARAVVWPEKKWRSNIYGDANRFKPLMEAAGYIRRDHFYGARLRRILNDDGYLIGPYLDCGPMVTDDGEYVVIDEDGGIDGQLTGGTFDAAARRCDRCSGASNELESVNYDEQWCWHCVRHYAFRCGWSGEYCSDAYGSVRMENGEQWSAAAFSDHGETCNDCDGSFNKDDAPTRDDDLPRCDVCEEDRQEQIEEDRQDELELETTTETEGKL